MTNYSIHHVETYGHGKRESNDLADDKKVKIAGVDGYYEVYECDSDEEAEKLANWYISAVYESYPEEIELVKNDSRYFSVEVVQSE